MILDVIAWGIVGLVFNWQHWIFWVEATLIFLFAFFWSWQTVELWNKGLRRQSATSGRNDPVAVVPPPALAGPLVRPSWWISAATCLASERLAGRPSPGCRGALKCASGAHVAVLRRALALAVQRIDRYRDA